VLSSVDIRTNGHKLTQLEEDSLVEWIFSMDSRGAAPRPGTVREMANILPAAHRIPPPPTVGVRHQVLLNAAMSFVHASRDDTIINVP
jgi:hypothetical protein